MTSKQKVIEKFVAFMDELEEFIARGEIAPKESEFEILTRLLNSDDWPVAVDPQLICDPNSTADQLERAEVILDDVPEDLTGMKVLDFGCGRGFVTQKAIELGIDAIGYDIVSDGDLWESDSLTTDFEQIKASAPYDVIILYDVIDHCEDPVDALKKVSEVCKPESRAYVTCHPWCSRHGAHHYNTINKAFIHLVFTDEELAEMGLKTEVLKVTSPVLTYQQFFREAGFKSYKPEIIRESAEKLFHDHPVIRQRIMKHTGRNQFPDFQLSQNFVKFKIVKS